MHTALRALFLILAASTALAQIDHWLLRELNSVQHASRIMGTLAETSGDEALQDEAAKAGREGMRFYRSCSPALEQALRQHVFIQLPVSCVPPVNPSASASSVRLPSKLRPPQPDRA
jgi:hypothetical protein